jgi:hypothetical protein
MKRWNLFAASVIATTFITLALLPLTREALRFDSRLMLGWGRPIFGSVLLDLGIRQEDLPFGGAGPALRAPHDDAPVTSSALDVQLAQAMLRKSPEKWVALQGLAAQFPQSAATHAALVRIACKNGGSVGVGHDDEQAALSPPKAPRYVKPSGKSQGEPADAKIMLRSCTAGERLAPENAYFPAMAAVAHLSLNQDAQAQAALHRAAEKLTWREYFDVEAAGRVRRAELLYGPQNSLTESATLASMLFPHYAALRAMARVVTAQAMQAELQGDFKTGLALRRDVARLGEKLRDQSSSLIGSMVGISMIRVSEGRPGGAPALDTGTGGSPADAEEGKSVQKQLDAQFLAYLTQHGEQAEATRWQRALTAADQTKAILERADTVSAFGYTTLAQTQWRLLVNQILLGEAILLCLLGRTLLLAPRLRRATPFIVALTLASFFLGLSWAAWQALGNLRDILAFSGLIQALAGNSGDSAANQQLAQAFSTQIALGGLALLLPLGWLGALVGLAKLQQRSLGQLLRATTLPLAAVLTLVYAGHLAVFSLRERQVRAELGQVIQHEGRYVAQKLGRAWPQ